KDGLGLRVLDQKIQLVSGRAPVHWRDNDACELTRPMNGCGFPAVLRGSEQVIAGLEPKLIESRDDARYAPIPLHIGQPDRAVDDGESLGATLQAGDEACAKIKHSQAPHEVSRQHRALPPVLERSRCSGTNGRRDIPAVRPRLD